jgi:hypothetical protein
LPCVAVAVCTASTNLPCVAVAVRTASMPKPFATVATRVAGADTQGRPCAIGSVHGIRADGIICVYLRGNKNQTTYQHINTSTP